MNEIAKGLVAFFSHDEAFGMPKGSVRATALLIMTGTICWMAATHGGTAGAALLTAFGSAVTFYFVGKKANGDHNDAPPPAPPA